MRQNRKLANGCVAAYHPRLDTVVVQAFLQTAHMGSTACKGGCLLGCWGDILGGILVYCSAACVCMCVWRPFFGNNFIAFAQIHCVSVALFALKQCLVCLLHAAFPPSRHNSKIMCRCLPPSMCVCMCVCMTPNYFNQSNSISNSVCVCVCVCV